MLSKKKILYSSDNGEFISRKSYHHRYELENRWRQSVSTVRVAKGNLKYQGNCALTSLGSRRHQVGSLRPSAVRRGYRLQFTPRQIATANKRTVYYAVLIAIRYNSQNYFYKTVYLPRIFLLVKKSGMTSIRISQTMYCRVGMILYLLFN